MKKKAGRRMMNTRAASNGNPELPDAGREINRISRALPLDARNAYRLFALLPTALILSAFALACGSPAKSGNAGKSKSGDAQGRKKTVPYAPPGIAREYLKYLSKRKQAGLSVAKLTAFEGSQNAYIIIHKFSDYRCPHCLSAGKILKKALKRWPGRIRVYYRHFPLDGNCNHMMKRKPMGSPSCNGARAALCAPEQNLSPALHYGIFQFQNSGTDIAYPSLRKLTRSLGGTWARLKTCMESKKAARLLGRDLEDAEKINILATPTLVVQDKIMPAGVPDEEFFLYLMDALVFQKEGRKVIPRP